MLLASARAYRPALSDIDLGLILECARVRYRRSLQVEPLFKRALAIDEKALGPNHPDVARDRNNLAALYRATKRGKEAETLERRAARIRAIQR